MKKTLSSSMKKLYAINENGRIIDDGGDLHLGEGVDLAESERTDKINPGKVILNAKARAGHFGCFGTTRTGKTRLLTSMVEQDIRGGRNLIVIDPKGDADLFSSVIQTAAESGRLDDLMMITPIFPDFSLRIDPLAYFYMPDELVDHVISGIQAKEEYFINVASEITTVIVSSEIALARSRNERPKLNFQNIKRWSSREMLEVLMADMSKLKSSPDPEMVRVADEVCTNISQIIASPADFFAKVSSSLRTTLTALTSSTTGQIIGKTYANEFIKRFEEGRKVILICNTGSLLSRRTAHIIGRVFLSMIQSMVGRFFASGRILEPSLCIYVDEGHNVLYKGIQELFNKGGGAGVWLHFFTQSIAQIEEEIGPESTQSILDNINTTAYMKVNHEQTARFVEESTPIRKVRQSILSFSAGETGISLRETEERMVLKERLMQLKPRWFYLRKEGATYKVCAPFVEDSYVKIQFPKIVGR